MPRFHITIHKSQKCSVHFRDNVESPSRCWLCIPGLPLQIISYPCIVLYWWDGHCCPMHYDLFKIDFAPPNLGIRTWISRFNFAQGISFQAWSSLTRLKSQTPNPWLKVPPGGLKLWILMSWKKSVDRSRVWTREPWISRRYLFFAPFKFVEYRLCAFLFYAFWYLYSSAQEASLVWRNGIIISRRYEA